MKVHIFRGKGRVFGFVPHPSSSSLPSEYGPWLEFKVLDMKRGEVASPAVHTEECLDDIETHGVHITDGHIRITEKVLNKS